MYMYSFPPLPPITVIIIGLQYNSTCVMEKCSVGEVGESPQSLFPSNETHVLR